MKKNVEELQNEFEVIQHKGKQSLRLFLIAFLLLLIAYFGIQFYLMSHIFEDFQKDIITYIWRLCLQLLWIIPFWQLWKYHKLGKFLYFLCLLYTLYISKDIYFYVRQSYDTFHLYHYILILLGVLWRILLSLGFIKLLHNSYIRSIWSVYDFFDEELADEERFLKEDNVPVVKDKPIVKKAKKRMHDRSIRMAIILYAYIICIILGLFILKSQMPIHKESIEIIERMLYGNFLFDAFLWILPITALYMYHRSTRWLLIIAGSSEIIKVFISFSSYVYIFSQSHVDSFVQIIFIIIELLRFGIFGYWIFKILRDPYSYYYWKRTTSVSNARSDKT